MINENKKNDISLEYEIIVKNKDNEIIKEIRKPAKSFVKNFMIGLRACFLGQNLTATTVEGTSAPIIQLDVTMHRGLLTCAFNILTSLFNDDSYGVVIGSGNAPVSINDTKLSNQIKNGVLINEILYITNTTVTNTFSSTSSKTYIHRAFLNQSGGTITINEMGVYGLGGRTVTGVSHGMTNYNTFLIIRDVITPITLHHHDQIEIKYIITTLL